MIVWLRGLFLVFSSAVMLLTACAPTPSETKLEDEDEPSTEDGEHLRETYKGHGCPEHTVGFAQEVVAVTFGDGETFGRAQLPDVVLGGPLGAGCCAGSLDVVSLGDGGSITLGFGDLVIVDGPGPDFIVFENAFYPGGNTELSFYELARVEVSADGIEYHEFPCQPDLTPPRGCAGFSPVFAHPHHTDRDVFDPQQAGGDAFDLADLGLEEVRYVRITDIQGDEAGFDLDAVSVTSGRCD